MENGKINEEKLEKVVGGAGTDWGRTITCLRCKDEFCVWQKDKGKEVTCPTCGLQFEA